MADLVALPPTQFDRKPWSTALAPLDEELWQRFNWFRDLCGERFGIHQFVLSGNRTNAEQVYLRQQNCGTSHYDVYQKPPGLCRPVTAIPGTSNHEGGRAIDCGYGYNDVAGPMIATARECGLRYAVKSEDWHVEVDANNRTRIPDRYTNPTPTPPDPEDDDMPPPFIGINPDNGENAIFYPGLPLRVHLYTPDDVRQALAPPPFGLGLRSVGNLDPWFFRNTEKVLSGAQRPK